MYQRRGADGGRGSRLPSDNVRKWLQFYWKARVMTSAYMSRRYTGFRPFVCRPPQGSRLQHHRCGGSQREPWPRASSATCRKGTWREAPALPHVVDPPPRPSSAFTVKFATRTRQQTDRRRNDTTTTVRRAHEPSNQVPRSGGGLRRVPPASSRIRGNGLAGLLFEIVDAAADARPARRPPPQPWILRQVPTTVPIARGRQSQHGHPNSTSRLGARPEISRENRV